MGVPKPQKSATLSPQPGGKPRNFIKTCGGTGRVRDGEKRLYVVKYMSLEIWNDCTWNLAVFLVGISQKLAFNNCFVTRNQFWKISWRRIRKFRKQHKFILKISTPCVLAVNHLTFKISRAVSWDEGSHWT